MIPRWRLQSIKCFLNHLLTFWCGQLRKSTSLIIAEINGGKKMCLIDVLEHWFSLNSSENITIGTTKNHRSSWNGWWNTFVWLLTHFVVKKRLKFNCKNTGKNGFKLEDNYTSNFKFRLVIVLTLPHHTSLFKERFRQE